MFNKYLLITLFLISTFNTNLFAQACNTPWNSSTVYNSGNTVSYNGRNYTNRWGNNGGQPDQNAQAGWGNWIDAGACSSCNTLNAGSIGAAQSISTNTAPNTLTNSTSASGGDGSNYNYQWQKSTNNSTWTDISGATSPTYSPGALTTNTYYRRKVTSGSCGDAFTTSILISIVVNSDLDNDGILNTVDLDDDNDGILDCVENGFDQVSLTNVFNITGNAKYISVKEIQLTPDLNSQAGSATSFGKIDFNNDFNFNIELFLGSNDGGADGLAIIFHNDPNGINTVGGFGSGLGASGIQNGIAIEFDTWDNGEVPEDHTQIKLTSTWANLNSLTKLPNIENGQWHFVNFKWNASTRTLSYSIDGNLISNYTNDLVANVFNNESSVHLGFTAGTGGAKNDQRIRFPDMFCNYPMFKDSDNDGIVNSLDLDSDGDGCADAIEGGASFKNVDLSGLSLKGAVDANGIPVLAGASGQTVGSSANSAVKDVDCKNELIIPDTLTICKGKSVTINAKNVKSPKWESSEPFTNVNDSTITATPTKTATYYVTSYTKKQNALINGDFETPNIGSGWALKNASEVTGWKTTATDNMIEIWTKDMGVTPYSGNQFIELNANMQAALFQDMATTPGSKLIWGFAHRGRSGTETIEFEVGPPGGPYAKIGSFSDALAWRYYSGVYEVPAGQTTTRFYYSSKDPGSSGNFIDAIEFYTTEEEKDNVVVKVNALPTVTANGVAICTGSSKALTVTGATTYAWSPNTNLSATTGATLTANPTSTITYTVTGIDANGCVGTDTAVVTVNQLPTTPVVAHVKACLNITPAPELSTYVTGSTIKWYTTVFGGSSISLPIVNSAVVGDTSYYVSQTNVEGCESARNKIDIDVIDIPYAQITSTDLNYCAGTGGVKLTVKDDGVNTVYEWFKNGVSQGLAGGTLYFSEATQGNWTVKLTNNLTGCTANSTVSTVVEDPIPLAVITTSGTALDYCANNPNGVSLTATDAGANMTYEWFKDNISQSSASITHRNFSPAFYGEWKVKVVSPTSSCAAVSNPVTVKEKLVPVATITNTGSNSDYCKGDPGIILTAQSVSGATYEWYKNNLSVGTGSTHNNALAGDWKLKVNLNGCEDTSALFTVIEKPLPIALITSSALSYCSGTNGVTLTASDAGVGATYEWFKKGISQGAESTSLAINNVLADDWTLKTVLHGCNNTSAIITITETPLPDAEITTLGEALKYCEGTNGVTLTAKDQGIGASYEWYLEGVLVNTTTTNTLANALEGNWTMKVTKGCTVTTLTATPVTKKPLPLATITSTLLEYCAGNSGVNLTATSVAGATYEWFKSGLSLGAASFNNTYNNALLGDYSVKVTLNLCEATSTKTTSIENVLPTASISGTGAICDNTGNAPLTIALTGTAPWNLVYQKPDGSTITSNGVASSPLIINESLDGAYKVLSVNDAKCAGTVSGTVTISYKTSPTISNVTRICTSLTTYTLSFDILHGDASSYFITGATGTLVGNKWTSNPMTESVSTAITVNDVNNCNPYTESFFKTCSCPADGVLSGGGTICNDGVTKANLIVTLEGDSPWNIEYTVDGGVAQAITGIVSSPYTFASSSKGEYKLTKVQDKNCTGSANGSAAVIYNNFPTAIISGSSTICVGKESANLNINFTGKSPWDFTVVEPMGNKTITGITANPYTYVANTVGNYVLSAINDAHCIGRLIDLSGSGTIAAYVKPDTSKLKLICDNSNKYFITMDIVGGDAATYQVTGAQGSFVGNQWTSAMIVSGTLTTLNITDARNCDPITISNLDKSCLCPASATMSGNKTFCADGTKASVSIAFNGTAPWNVSYKKDGGTAISVTTNSNPLLIPNIDKSGSYTMVSVSDDKCTGTVSGSATIIVNELPTAIVTGGGTACYGDIPTKVNINLTGTPPYNLTYSDGTTSKTVIETSSKYIISSPSDGSYTSVGLTDDNGCVATKLLGTANVQLLPVSSVTIDGAAGICYGDQTPITITFTNTSIAPYKLTYDGGSGYQIISGITTSPYSISISPQQTSSFKIIELLDKYKCANKTIKDSVIVDVTKIPILNIINNSTAICSGSTTSIRFLSNFTPTSYTWTAVAPSTITGVVQPGSGDSISQSLSNSNTTLEFVTYTVIPTAYTTSNKACVGNSKPVKVIVRKPTVLELGSNRGSLCVGDSMEIDAGNFPYGYANGKSIGHYEWYVNDVKTIDSLNKTTFAVSKGTTKISVGYTDACNHTSLDSVILTSKEHVKIDFDKRDTCLSYSTLLLPTQVSNEESVTSWGWKMVNNGDSLNSTADSPNANYKFPSEGKQIVRLSAYNDGCKIGDTIKTFKIKYCSLNPDNVFTPNGDGHNDTWKITGIEDFPNADIVLFNRWGVLVHYIPGTALVPWDGTNDSGQLQEAGTYYYVITLNQVSGFNQFVKGYVTIILE